LTRPSPGFDAHPNPDGKPVAELTLSKSTIVQSAEIGTGTSQIHSWKVIYLPNTLNQCCGSGWHHVEADFTLMQFLFHSDADPDTVPHQREANLQLTNGLQNPKGSIVSLPLLLFEPSQLPA
jgi:hypothetical protein